MVNIKKLAPPLKPGRPLPSLQGKKKGQASDGVLEEMARKIKKLEKVIESCDVVMAKGERLDLRKRKKHAKLIDSDGVKELIDRVFYRELQKRKEQDQLRAEKLLFKQEGITLSTGQLEDLVERVHDDALAKRHMLQDKMTESINSQNTIKCLLLDPAALRTIGDRLSTQEMETRDKKHHHLRDKHLSAPQQAHTFTKGEQQEALQRLYFKPLQQLSKTRESLRSRYTPEIEARKLTQNQQNNMVSRLCK